MGKYDPITSNELLETKKQIDSIVTDKCTKIINQLKKLRGGDKGTFSIETDKGTWELKYNEEGVKYLRRSIGGEKVYVVSKYGEKDLNRYLETIEDFHNFISKFNEWVSGKEKNFKVTREQLENDLNE